MATEKGSAAVALDLKDPVYAALAGYAGRIAKLLSIPSMRNNVNLAGSLDDFLGAVYALIQAKQHGFTDRTGPIDITAVEKRAQQITGGRLRTDGKWIAGFYFNNALFRTAAVYHRVLTIVAGKDAYVPALRVIVQKRYQQWQSSKLDLVHNQVNDLKHTPRGVHDQRTVKYADATAAVGEMLVLIEASTTATSSGAKP